MQIGFGFWASKVLLNAVELGVFTELAQQPGTAQALKARLGLHARSSRDFLDALVALGLLQRRNGQYHNASDTDMFLDKGKPSYIGGILEMANHRLYGSWGQLTEALQTGQPQSEIKDGDESFFDTRYEDPQRLREFLSAMSGVSRAANCAIARQFPWQEVESFADVGTAQGDLAVQVARAHPHLSGIGFDYTGADCQAWLKEAGFRETRVEHLVGPDSMVIGIK